MGEQILWLWGGGTTMPAVTIRNDIGPDELRRRAREHDGRVSARLIALANALEGMDRATAARLAGMDRQTLRDWVHRYNAQGIAGLSNRPLPGRLPKLSEGQMASLKVIVLRGPDPATDGIERWRIVDLCRWWKSAGASPTAKPGCCGCCGRSTCRTARPGRFTRAPTRRRRIPSKKGVRRASGRDRSGPSRGRALRDMEPRRSAGRADRPYRLHLVAARPNPARAARLRAPLGLDHRRGMSRARHRRGAGDDPARHRGNEPVSRRTLSGCRARRARRRADGQGGMAYQIGRA